MEFDTLKTLDLSFLGWNDCELIFRSVTVKQSRVLQKTAQEDLLDVGMKLLADNFVNGKGMVKGERLDVKKENLEDLPLEVINKCVELLVESTEVDKKK